MEEPFRPVIRRLSSLIVDVFMTVEVKHEGRDLWCAAIPALTGAVARGKTKDEALAMLKTVVRQIMLEKERLRRSSAGGAHGKAGSDSRGEA